MNYSGYLKDSEGNKYYPEMPTISLTSSINLDNITTIGFYYCNDTNNQPAENGYLFVQKASDKYIYQRYITYNGEKIYERFKVDNIWQNWELKETKLKEFTATSYLVNSWSDNGTQIFIKDRVKTLNVSIRYGKSSILMNLPDELQPKSSMLIVGDINGSIGYILLLPDGTVQAQSNLITEGASNGNIFFNASYI